MKSNLYLIVTAILLTFVFNSYGQQQISWRSEASSGNWFENNLCDEIGNGNSQWFYPGFGSNSSRNAPDCFGIHDLYFNNNHQLTTDNNNEGRFTVINRLTFGPNADAPRTINGDGVDITIFNSNRPIIRNLSPVAHTINTPIAIISNPIEINPVDGDLIITNNIFTNGNFIDVFGNNGHTLRLSGNLQGSGGITLKENSIIEIATAITYTGGTAIEAGVLRIEPGGSLSNATDVILFDTAVFDLNDQDITVRSVTEAGFANAGTIDLGTGTLTIHGGYIDDRFQNSIEGSGNIVKNGTGNLNLFGSQTYTGTTTVNGGIVSSSVDLQTSEIIVNNGGEFHLTDGNDISINSLTINAGGVIRIPTGHTLTVNGTLTLDTNATHTLDGSLIFGTNSRLVIKGNTNFETNDAIFPATNGPVNFEINHSGTVTLHDSRMLDGDIDVTSGTLIINEGTGLTAANLNNAGTVRLNSTSTAYSSLIVNTVSGGGSIIYNRYVNSNENGNDLIAPPVSGQTWQGFLASGTNAVDLLDNGASAPTLYAFGPFEKSSGTYLTWADTTVETLTSGTGYRAATDAGTTLTFTGNVLTTAIDVDIEFSGSAFPDWNLIGNPYPSYISIDAFLEYETASGATNAELLATVSGIYGYDGNASDGWDVVTASSGRLMAPGQGFLVPAASDLDGNTAMLTFHPDMRRTGNSDDFILGRNAQTLTFLKLKASTTSKSYNTQFYFNTNSSVGLDQGYDGKILGAVPSFALYSQLVQDNTGLPIALQSLHTSDLASTTVIPLGVNANAGEQLTFSIAESSLPTAVEVYLEDALANTFTLLNTGDYTLTPNSALNGVGRFFLRFGESALSTGDTHLENLAIYTNKTNKTIVIAGQLLEHTTVYVYDLQGRLVLSKQLDAKLQLNQISTNSLRQGVYILELSGTIQNRTTKIILN